VGQFDGCLFSLHRPQSVGRTMEQEVGGGEFGRMVSSFSFFSFPSA
jgi:mitochondrial distribution and morphology protein 31